MLNVRRIIGRHWHQSLRQPLVTPHARGATIESKNETRQRKEGARRYLKRAERSLPPETDGGVTFQFVEDERRGDKAKARIYVWGNAHYGALGQPGFLMPRLPKQNILSQMHKPFRWVGWRGRGFSNPRLVHPTTSKIKL